MRLVDSNDKPRVPNFPGLPEALVTELSALRSARELLSMALRPDIRVAESVALKPAMTAERVMPEFSCVATFANTLPKDPVAPAIGVNDRSIALVEKEIARWFTLMGLTLNCTPGVPPVAVGGVVLIPICVVNEACWFPSTFPVAVSEPFAKLELEMLSENSPVAAVDALGTVRSSN